MARAAGGSPTERGRAARPDLCLGTPELAESTRLKHRLEVVRGADHLLRSDRAKPIDQYLAILDAYADQGVASYWYVMPPVAQERILQAAAVLDVGDLVTVCDWPPGHGQA